MKSNLDKKTDEGNSRIFLLYVVKVIIRSFYYLLIDFKMLNSISFLRKEYVKNILLIIFTLNFIFIDIFKVKYVTG